MEYVLFTLGFILLIKAGDYFVDASIHIAKIFKCSEIIIGATVVSIGTTLPELMVSASSAAIGHSGISYGNAIGSIICNTALVAALSMAIAPGKIDREEIKIPTIFFFCSALYYAICTYFRKRFIRFDGVLLVINFIIYVYAILKKEKSRVSKVIDVKEKIKETENYILGNEIIVLIISGLVIAFASRLLIDNGIIIARNIGVSETVIGITFIALGTSLPELTTCITSLIKGYSSLSVGNIIGADLFNILLVSGVSIAIKPFSVPFDKSIFNVNASYIVDIPLMFLVLMIMTLPILLKSKTYRWQGITLLCMYALFVVYQFMI